MFDLDPTPTIRTTGRRAEPLQVDYVRSLCAEDLVLLDQPRAAKPQALKAIRARHHTLARMLASGKRPTEVAAITGYCVSRISILQGDPAFRELLEFYKANADAAYADLHEKLAGVSHTAVDLLAERMEDRPDEVQDSVLIDIAKMGADRTGHGPQAKQTNVNVNVNLAGRLSAAQERLQAYRAGNLIEGEAHEVTPLLPRTVEQSPASTDPATTGVNDD